MIPQTEQYYDDRWTKTIKSLPKGGEYRLDFRKGGHKIIADYIGSGRKVFDYATGVSNLPALLKENDCDVYGCDFSGVAVEYAGKWGLFKKTDKIEGEYDYITACQFIEHIENPVEWVKGALEHAPVVICSIPNNFRKQGDHYLMQWNSMTSFMELFKDLEVERIDNFELYGSTPNAWRHPTFVFKKK